MKLLKKTAITGSVAAMTFGSLLAFAPGANATDATPVSAGANHEVNGPFDGNLISAGVHNFTDAGAQASGEPHLVTQSLPAGKSVGFGSTYKPKEPVKTLLVKVTGNAVNNRNVVLFFTDSLVSASLKVSVDGHEVLNKSFSKDQDDRINYSGVKLWIHRDWTAPMSDVTNWRVHLDK